MRKSNFELLRIISIMLIMMMHSFGTPLSELNKYVVIAVTVIGNIGTTSFIILSGYFGVKCNAKKLVRLDLMIIVYCLLGFFTDYLINGEFSLRELVSCVIPITSHRYWFLSCYFFLCILSPFINEYIDALSKKRLEALIAVMLALFAVLPTIFGFDVMQDGGKGLVNMTLAYIIGRYLGKYAQDWRLAQNTGKCAGYLMLLCVVNFVLNAVMYTITGSDANYYARDNSVFTIAEAVLLFLIFRQMKFSSRMVNRAAANVVAVYVLEAMLSHLLRYFYDYTVLADRWYYVFIVLAVVAVTFLAGICLEALRRLLFGRQEERVADAAVEYVKVRIEKWKK
jgi:MFS family permease